MVALHPFLGYPDAFDNKIRGIERKANAFSDPVAISETLNGLMSLARIQLIIGWPEPSGVTCHLFHLSPPVRSCPQQLL